MDRRILIIIAIFLFGSLSFLLYHTFYYKYKGIAYDIRPKKIIYVGDSIVYRDETRGATRWKWDFGDGEYSADQSGTHFYLTPEKFRVILTVYGAFGALKATQEVSVLRPESPTVQINGAANLVVNNSASFEADMAADDYEWHIEGDPSMSGRVQKSRIAVYNFSNPGIKTIVLVTHHPDNTINKEVSVAAADEPQQAIVKPHTRPHNNIYRPSHQGGGLEPLGNGVPINH